MKLGSNLSGREMEGRKRLFSLLSLLFPAWICDLQAERDKSTGKPELFMNHMDLESPDSSSQV